MVEPGVPPEAPMVLMNEEGVARYEEKHGEEAVSPVLLVAGTKVDPGLAAAIPPGQDLGVVVRRRRWWGLRFWVGWVG